MKVFLLGLFLILGFLNFSFSQHEYQVISIGFYNFENLFDTSDDPDNWGDDEFLPTSGKNWNAERYGEKLQHLAQVVSELGTDLTPDGVAILGIAEVENRNVLEDFVQQEQIKTRNYQIIHFDSPDHRGIDVGLLYNPKYFQPVSTKAIPVRPLVENGDALKTRDILYVKGILDNDTIHILVNHWPSRRGGEAASSHLREFAAAKNKALVDSLTTKSPNPKVLIMGDLNDDPINPSVKKVLKAQRKSAKTRSGEFYNPMFNYYQKGIGSNAWRDSWNLFDQIIVSYGLLEKNQPGYRFLKANVHNKKYLTQTFGQYKGYPFRTWVGNTYLGGYSDHFPVYIYLVKPKS